MAENRVKIESNCSFQSMFSEELMNIKKDINKQGEKSTPLKAFTDFKNAIESKQFHFKNSCKDLDNKIKTTDRYIDQFLPFRMI